MKKVPPAPAGWKLTIADLCAEMKAGKRKSVGSPETDWARDYERSLLPANTRFPKKGDVFEAVEDVQIQFMTAWAAPFTGSGEGILKKGERVFIDQEPSTPKPIGVYAVAMDYDAAESRLVSGAERSDPKYSGFYFSLKTAVLNRQFRLVDTGYEKEANQSLEPTAPSGRGSS